MATLKIRNLPDRAAIVKRRGKRTVRVETVEVKPVLEVPKMLGRFREKTFAKSPYVSSSESALAQIEKRQVVLYGPAEPVSTENDFWAQE